jgi:dienelactone hydrolase
MSCCPTEILPVKGAVYTPQGSKVYVTGDVKSTRGILYIPDIFGPHPNVFRVCDLLAKKGFLVVCPDFFPASSEWPMSDFPPADGFGGAKFQGFIGGLQYPKVRHVVLEGIQILKSYGVKSIGAVGMCWGGKIALRANAEGLIQSAASPHPSFLDESDGADAKGPICLLPSGDEDAALMEKVMNAAAPHGKGHNVHKRFDSMHHGYLAARGDFDNNEENRKVAQEAIDILGDFFVATLPA